MACNLLQFNHISIRLSDLQVFNWLIKLITKTNISIICTSTTILIMFIFTLNLTTTCRRSFWPRFIGSVNKERLLFDTEIFTSLHMLDLYADIILQSFIFFSISRSHSKECIFYNLLLFIFILQLILYSLVSMIVICIMWLFSLVESSKFKMLGQTKSQKLLTFKHNLLGTD